MRGSLLLCGKAQAFTLEGIVSAVMMLMVAYFLFHSTIIISPLTGEASDAQLKYIGIDTLNILNSEGNWNGTLHCLANLNCQELLDNIDKILPDNVDYSLQVIYTSGEVKTHPIVEREYTEDTVSVSKYIVFQNSELVNSPFFFNESSCVDCTQDMQYPVVLEVKLVLWRV
ncbi:MAG TPA: hypothetical protein EYP30_07780 [Archaeoglobaceae archaeon]|nr:hypothetical protein [Archaeoglobaceae archaeon]